METQRTAEYVIGGIVLILIGAIVGALSDPYLPASLSNAKKGYQAGFDAAKALVLNSSAGSFFRTPDDVRLLQGTITAIDGNRVTFHVNSMNPFDDPTLADRTALLGSSIVITKILPKDPKTYQAELASFTKAPQGATSPAPFTTVAANVANLGVGTTISVTASENIKTLQEFPAAAIQILPGTSTP